jgi:hypothetical protein
MFIFLATMQITLTQQQQQQQQQQKGRLSPLAPTGIVASASERTTLVISPMAHVFTCFDAKNNSYNNAMRQSTFECVEHEARPIENWLIPHVMCCNALQCVPSFAEQQQTFPIAAIQCNESNDRCHIILHCHDALEALKKIIIGTIVAVVIVIVSTFWVDKRARKFTLSRLAFYEDAVKTE